MKCRGYIENSGAHRRYLKVYSMIEAIEIAELLGRWHDGKIDSFPLYYVRPNGEKVLLFTGPKGKCTTWIYIIEVYFRRNCPLDEDGNQIVDPDMPLKETIAYEVDAPSSAAAIGFVLKEIIEEQYSRKIKPCAFYYVDRVVKEQHRKQCSVKVNI